MKVQVTQDHIDNGHRNSAVSCPIALALKETPGATNVSVGIGTASIGYGNVLRYDYKRTYYHLPWQATEFIDRFDFGDPVQPFEFEMEPM